MKKKTIILVTLALMLLGVNTNAQMSEKPRVIAMTDGEIDDQCSMIRFLLHANDMEVVAIIQTNSIFQRGGWSNAGWIEKQLDAYEQVYPNLIEANSSLVTKIQHILWSIQMSSVVYPELNP